MDEKILEKNMIIRKAGIQELNFIMNIIKDAIIDMESKEIYQWDDMYPNREIIGQDISEGTLYESVENKIINGIIVLNEDQAKEYEDLNWKYFSGKQLVIHRLCVDPKYQEMGIAKSLINFAENFARDNNYKSIRLDAFIKNKVANKLYEKVGYEKVGIVDFRKGEFYCFEKRLSNISILEKDIVEIELIRPLWEKLNSIHVQKSIHFRSKYENFTFSKRMKSIYKKARRGIVKLHMVFDSDTKKYVGYCLSSIENNSGEIESIYIENQYRKLGIGGQLIEDALNWFKAKGITNIQIGVVYGNDHALPFYERYGFNIGSYILKRK